MHQTDFEDFAKTLHKLAAVFTRKLNDEFIQAYWDALKDEPLSTVIRLADQHTRYGKFFPKPVELRPKEEKPPKSRDLEGEARFREGEMRAIANLEELRRENPVLWAHEVRARRNARILAVAHPGSLEYADALAADPYLRHAAGWIGPYRVNEALPQGASPRLLTHEVSE